MGISASIFSLMLGLLIQTLFYEIAHKFPSVYRQDAHISLPLCNIFPDLYGCDPWVGALTGLEIWRLSLQVGQVCGLCLNLILATILSMEVTISTRSNSMIPGFLTGVACALSSLVLAVSFNVPLSIHTDMGIFGLLTLSFLPLSGFAGGQIGKRRLAKQLSHKRLSFQPVKGAAQTDAIVQSLSERELEVLAFVAEGFKNHEIAKRLYISKATVKTHLQHIYAKLRVKNRTAAVTQALAYGLLRQEQEDGGKES
jgi:DNA-binding CsgD family transcriptional regulator